MIWWIVTWAVTVLICKTLRDASWYCWSHTWMSRTWLDSWNNVRVPFDLRHICDGIIITGSFALIFGIYFYYENDMQFGNREWLLLAGCTVVFWLIFYQLFNLFYHKWIRK